MAGAQDAGGGAARMRERSLAHLAQARPHLSKASARLPRRAALVVLAATFLTLPAQAPAAYRHPAVKASFGSDGTEGSTIEGVSQMAFNQASKRLYVLDRNTPQIDGFDTSTAGTYTPLTGNFPISVAETGGEPELATDNSSGSAGNIYYLSESNGLYGFTSSGTGLTGLPSRSSFGDPCGVAVDGEGHVWVADYSSQAIKEYSSGGAALGSVNVSATGSPCLIAFDSSTEDLYVADYGSGVYLYKHGAGGYSTGTLVDNAGKVRGIAVDSSTHTVYVAHSGAVDAYNAGGTKLEEFAAGRGGNYTGVAVDEVDGVVYVGDSSNGGKVLVVPGVIVPNVTTGNQTGDATVNGEVDPAGGGEITSCLFEYGTTTSYEATMPCEPGAPLASATEVHADLAGHVLGETLYHYRLVAGNENGVNYGEDQTFTPHFVSGLVTDEATAVGKNEATFNGHFLGTEEDTKYYFEYGTTAAYGHSTPVEDAGSTSGETKLSYTVTGLEAGTIYHYRVKAENSKGVSPGNDESFRTVDAVAGIATEAATGVTASTATLHGSWTGNGEQTTCRFDWGYNASYGNSTPEVDEGSAPSGTQTTSVTLAQLSPVTTFHYEVVCHNGTGQSYGGDETLTTLAVPAVAVLPTTELSTTGVTLNGTVDPQNGGPTTYHFDYGTEESYGSSTAESAPVGADEGTYPASGKLSGLNPGTTYHYRLVATSPAGIEEGADHTFTTVPLEPAVEATDATPVNTTEATLAATVNPGFGATVVFFDYGTDLSYGSSTLPTVPTPASGSDQRVSAPVKGLTPGTTYHFRAVAINFGGVVDGPDRTFTMPALAAIAPPAVASTPPPPGSAPPPPQPRPHCHRHFVLRHGKCVKKRPHHRHRSHHRHHRRRGHGGRNG